MVNIILKIKYILTCFLSIAINNPTSLNAAKPLIIDLHSDTLFDFKELLKENQKFPPVEDRCQLRIYGGKEAVTGDIPYQVALRKLDSFDNIWKTFCGGAIVTDTYVLTAAHCFDRVLTRSTRVVAGTQRSNAKKLDNQAPTNSPLIEVWREIVARHTHAYYQNSGRRISNDFSVLKLSEPLIFSNTIRPIPIAKKDLDIPEGTLCLTSGFGYKENMVLSSTLRMVCVPVVTYDQCRRIYGNMIYSKDDLICAGDYGKDSCQGDSGGPIVCKGRLVGLVSFGAHCGQAPGVYTRLSAYTTGANVPFRTINRSDKAQYHLLCIILFLFRPILMM